MKIEPDIIAVLEAAIVPLGNPTHLVLTGQLDRKTYEATNKVLDAIGGKWNRKAKAHIFPDAVADVLDPILLTGEYSRTKQDFGQFDTPQEIAQQVIERACILPEMTVLEPSAGTGSLARAALASAAQVTVDLYEIDPKRYATLEAWANDFLRPCGLTDFLRTPPDPCYDRVVMNPPFAKQADIDHVLHAFQFLLPGGRLVAIMSASVSFRSNRKTEAFREFVYAHGGTIEPLPEGSFAESGTNVNTILVTVDRPE